MRYDTETRQAMMNRAKAFITARRDLTRDGDCVEAIIMAVIEAGTTTRDAIVRAVPKLIGGSYASVAWTLDDRTGDQPGQHLWSRDETKTYRLLETVAA